MSSRSSSSAGASPIAAAAKGTSSSGTSVIEPSRRLIRTSTGWAAVAVAALDRQVDVVRQRVDRHVLDDDVGRLAAQERADARVDVLQVERLGPARRARVRDVDGEHRRRRVVGQEQDPGRPERDRPGGPEIQPASPQPSSLIGPPLPAGTAAQPLPADYVVPPAGGHGSAAVR